MSTHIHTYTYIHTHIQNVHMNACKTAWNDGAAANARWAVLERGSFPRFFRSTQSNHISHLQCKEGKQRCIGAEVSEHAGIQAREWSRWLFTKKREVNEKTKKRPNPATVHKQWRQRGAQTTSRSSALVRGWSTQFIANLCRWLQRPCPKRGYIPPFLSVTVNLKTKLPCDHSNVCCFAHTYTLHMLSIHWQSHPLRLALLFFLYTHSCYFFLCLKAHCIKSYLKYMIIK